LSANFIRGAGLVSFDGIKTLVLNYLKIKETDNGFDEMKGMIFEEFSY
jgi:hypothetical protein